MNKITGRKLKLILICFLLAPCVHPQDEQTAADAEQITRIIGKKNSAEKETKTLKKNYGVIILAKEGGMVWEDKLRRVAVKIGYGLPGKIIPVEIVYGENASGLEKAVNRLSAERIKKLIIIPVYLSSSDSKLEYMKYVLGINKTPPEVYFEPREEKPGLFGFESFFKRKKIFKPKKEYSTLYLKQIETKLPVVMTGAIDGSLAEETLSMNLKPFIRLDKNYCLVILSNGTDNKKYDESRYTSIVPPVEKLARDLNLKSARVFLLDPGAKSQMQKNTAENMHEYVRKTSLDCKVILAGYSLYEREMDKIVRDTLFGAFYTYAKTITPSALQLEKWIKEKIKQAQTMSPADRFVSYKDKRERSVWKIF